MRGNKNSISKIWDNLPSGKVIENLLEQNFIHMSSLVLKKSALLNFKQVFNSNYTILGDIDLCIRLNLKWNLSSIQKPITYYRYHESNTGKTLYHLIVEEYKLMYDDIQSLHSNNQVIEGMARMELGYIKKGETFYQLVSSGDS